MPQQTRNTAVWIIPLLCGGIAMIVAHLVTEPGAHFTTAAVNGGRAAAIATVVSSVLVAVFRKRESTSECDNKPAD